VGRHCRFSRDSPRVRVVKLVGGRRPRRQAAEVGCGGECLAESLAVKCRPGVSERGEARRNVALIVRFG
jgi:hypothetical protein